MTFFLFVAALGVLLFRVTTPEDRDHYLKIGLATFQQLKAAATKPRPELETFDAELRSRTARALAAPAMVALCGVALVLHWDGSVGTRTTNGEWWRLLTSIFAHPTLLQLAINAGALYQVGQIIERLAGRAVMALAFLSAAVLAGVASIAVQPVAPTGGTTGGILGLYGVLIAAVILSRRAADVPDEFRITIPTLAIRRIAIVGTLVIIINALAGAVPLAGQLAGLAAGLACGLALMRGTAESTPPAPRIAATAAGAVILAIATAWPLNGIADVRPEIARIVDTEDRTNAAYLAAMEGLKKGKTTVDGVAQLIDGTISPELEAVDARLKALRKVPPEHQGLVNDAEEFLRLREESWRLRSASLRESRKTPTRKRTEDDLSADAAWRMRVEKQFRSTRAAIGKAEAVERSSLEVLARLKPTASRS